jgi:hypothetical protein
LTLFHQIPDSDVETLHQSIFRGKSWLGFGNLPLFLGLSIWLSVASIRITSYSDIALLQHFAAGQMKIGMLRCMVSYYRGARARVILSMEDKEAV